MNIRNRLLVSFVAVAVAVLVVFGFIAYRIAQQASAEEAALTWQTLLEEIAEEIAPSLQRQPYDLNQLRQLRFPYLRHAKLFLVHDPEGHSLDIGPWQRDQFAGKTKLFTDLAESGRSRSGQTDIEDETFTWASVIISGTNLRLTLVYPGIADESATLMTVAKRLLVTAGVVIWIAVWGALFITPMLTRHLFNVHAGLVHKALHDELTSLPNRSLLFDRLEQELGRARRDEHTGALFLMDLDRFKEVNDTLGHHVGDQVLQQVGQRIASTLRDIDTVARLGGDEFAILLPDADAEAALNCARKVLATFDLDVAVSGRLLPVKASIGIALYPHHGADIKTLLVRADDAMYEAKRSGSGFRMVEG